MPRKTSEETPKPDPKATGEPVYDTSVVARDPAPVPQDPPVPMPPNRARSQRNRRLVWLSVAATTLIGALWTSLATSMVDNTRAYFVARLEVLQGGPEIKRLNDELKRMQAEHDAVLTQKKSEYDALLNQTGLGITAYVRLAFRSQHFCMNEVKAWARENGYAIEEVGDPDMYIARVIYFGANLEMRCVGGRFSPMTFLVISGTAAAGSKSVDGAQGALATRLAAFNTYPAVASPGANNWFTNGPFVEVGYLTMEMNFVEFQRWEAGTIPPAVQSTLTRSGTTIRTYSAKGYAFIAADEPGSSVTLRSPDTDGYSLLAPDGTWKARNELLAPDTVPFPETRVRTRLIVAVAGLIYGQNEVDSPQQRYLGQDALDRLSTLPGVVDGGKVETFLRSW